MSLKQSALKVKGVDDSCDAWALAHKFGTNVYVYNKPGYRTIDHHGKVDTWLGKRDYVRMSDGRLGIASIDVNSALLKPNEMSSQYKADKYGLYTDEKGSRSYGMVRDVWTFEMKSRRSERYDKS